MDGYDAANHIRDLHREAERRRLVRLAQAGATRRRNMPVSPAVIVSIVLVALILATRFA